MGQKRDHDAIAKKKNTRRENRYERIDGRLMLGHKRGKGENRVCPDGSSSLKRNQGTKSSKTPERRMNSIQAGG